MIQPSELAALIQGELPDAEVEIVDKTGMADHYLIRVASAQFASTQLMDRHRQVMTALAPALQDGRLHAAEIQTVLLPATSGS